MGRKAKGPAFTLRSPNNTTFKMMGSSPIKNDEKITWGKEKEVSSTSDDYTTEKAYETRGVSFTPPERTPEGDLKYASLSDYDKKKQDEAWIKANTKEYVKGRKTIESKFEPIPSLGPKPLEVKVSGEPKPEDRKYKRIRDYELRKYTRGDKYNKRKLEWPKLKGMFTGGGRPSGGCKLGECVEYW
tara:strand:+ start:1124 stop:1681 length:558 start_codon:yes stop_codon:yes gene_type:complete